MGKVCTSARDVQRIPLASCPLSSHSHNHFIYFYLREREREREHASGGGTEGKRENLKQAPHSALSPAPDSIPQPWDHDLSQNQESDAQPTESPRCPPYSFLSLLHIFCFKKCTIIRQTNLCYGTKAAYPHWRPHRTRISSVVTAGISITEAPINSTVLRESLNKSVDRLVLYTVTFP